MLSCQLTLRHMLENDLTALTGNRFQVRITVPNPNVEMNRIIKERLLGIGVQVQDKAYVINYRAPSQFFRNEGIRTVESRHNSIGMDVTFERDTYGEVYDSKHQILEILREFRYKSIATRRLVVERVLLDSDGWEKEESDPNELPMFTPYDGSFLDIPKFRNQVIYTRPVVELPMRDQRIASFPFMDVDQIYATVDDRRMVTEIFSKNQKTQQEARKTEEYIRDIQKEIESRETSDKPQIITKQVLQAYTYC